jgi:hypothetical protein
MKVSDQHAVAVRDRRRSHRKITKRSQFAGEPAHRDAGTARGMGRGDFLPCLHPAGSTWYNQPIPAFHDAHGPPRCSC